MSEQTPPGPSDPSDTQTGTQTQSPGGPDTAGPRVTGDQMRDLGRLRRTIGDRHIAGVAGGLGRHFDIDPVIARVAFVVFTFFGGAGILIYGAVWLLVPDDADRVPIRVDARSRGVALIGVGVLAALSLFSKAVLGFGWSSWFPWPLVIIGGVAWLLLSRRDRRAEMPPTNYPPNYAAGSPAGAQGLTAYAAPGAGPATAPASHPESPAVSPPGSPAGPSYYDYQRSRNPRKRGPILFWFTLGLIALGMGTLGTVDLAGVDVLDSAYPALALGIIAVMLLVGAFYGRAGGLIFLGLLTAMGLTIGTVVDRYDGTRINEQPAVAAAVDSNYEMSAGRIKLDLSRVSDLENLDGRTVRVRGDLGRIKVTVPEELRVEVNATMEGGGEIELFGERLSDWDYTVNRVHRGPAGAPELTIDAGLGFGEIVVVTR